MRRKPVVGVIPGGGFLFYSFRQDWSPSQRVGSRSPILASTGMLQDSTPTPPKGEGRRVSSRQTRYFLLHQRKYPKSVSRGRTPWIPPSQLKCTDSFPAATYDGVGGSRCHALPVRDARLPSDSDWSAGRFAALRSSSLQSIRAAHDGAALRFGGLRPCADRVTAASSTQLAAWLGTALRADAGNGGKAPQ